MECGGWRFPEERLVFAGEPSELPEAILRGDLRHPCRPGRAVAQGPPPIMQSMARSWVALGNQMDRLEERDPVNAAHLALAR